MQYSFFWTLLSNLKQIILDIWHGKLEWGDFQLWYPPGNQDWLADTILNILWRQPRHVFLQPTKHWPGQDYLQLVLVLLVWQPAEKLCWLHHLQPHLLWSNKCWYVLIQYRLLSSLFKFQTLRRPWYHPGRRRTCATVLFWTKGNYNVRNTKKSIN